MCGIFGLVASESSRLSSGELERLLRHLALKSQVRGKDSSGLVFYRKDEAKCRVIKGDLRVSKLLASDTVRGAIAAASREYSSVGRARQPYVAAGHSRLVTNGTQLDDDNNQPVVKDSLVATHNGIIVNDEQIWERKPELNRDYRIDTEVFLALLRQQIDSGAPLPQSISNVYAEVAGTVSIATFVPEFGALVLSTDNGSLYTLSNYKDLLCFASEYYPLASAAERFGLSNDDGYRVEQVSARSGLVIGLDEFDLASFEFDGEDNAASWPERREGHAIEVQSVQGVEPQKELVRDVAEIAAAPDARHFEKMLESNGDRISKLARCTKCVLPETFPFIEFDADGICNYCRHYKVRNQPKPFSRLEELVEPYRRKDGRPDCIVPFSGGRDSTYALHIIKTRLDMNPIAYTYDWGMVTDLGRRNIARVCGKLGVENIIVAADIHWKRENIRKNVEAWLKRPHLGMIPLFMAGDKYFYYYVDQVKRQTGIALNIWGVNPMENTDFKVGFLGVAPDHEKKYIYSLSLMRQLKLFWGAGKAALSNLSYLNGSIPDTLGSFASRSLKPHRDYHHLYDYMLWDEKVIDTVLFDEYDWEKAVDTDTTWRIGDGTAAFYNYIYYTVAGFSEHDTFRSNQIREGMLDREEALRLIEVENRPRYPTIRWYTDAIHVDYERAIRTINAIPKLYA